LTTLFLLTQTKAHNIPLYLLFRVQFSCLSTSPSIPHLHTSDLPIARIILSPTATALTTLLLSQTAFFALGNTNAISSIDLSHAYNGVSDYNIVAVGLLVFLSNWAGPVYFSLAGLLLLGAHGRTARYLNTAELDTRDWVTAEHEFLHNLARAESRSTSDRLSWAVWRRHVALLTLWTGVMLVGVMVACTALRTHLFIWTVFSPKYLYAMAWGVAWHWGITVGLGALVWWAGMV
jgi:ethanolaminephosphotransferase